MKLCYPKCDRFDYVDVDGNFKDLITADVRQLRGNIQPHSPHSPLQHTLATFEKLVQLYKRTLTVLDTHLGKHIRYAF